jgi:hypothetical protein
MCDGGAIDGAGLSDGAGDRLLRFFGRIDDIAGTLATELTMPEVDDRQAERGGFDQAST